MSAISFSKLKFLFVQPEWDRRYVAAFPTYEPLHGLLLGGLIQDIADTYIFDRRFDTDENFIKILQEFKPDMVGSSSHTGGEIPNIKRLFGLAKKECPQTVTIVGGQHPTLLPEDFFHPHVDLICIGPGEETFREVALSVLDRQDFTKVSGLAVRSGVKYVITPPRIVKSGVMTWPKFDRSLILDKYKKNYGFVFEFRNNIYTITTSGCPHRCSFCSLWAAARGTFRYRRPEEVVEDIISQPQTYVHLTDDNTFYNEDNAMEIYRLLKKHHVKKKILAYARTDTIVNKTHLLERWKEIGLGALVVGMEAVTDSHLAVLNKRSSVDINVQAQKVLDRLGIENWAHFVIMPEFQKADFDAIWDFVNRHHITYPVFVAYTPVPGTPLFFEAKHEGKLASYDYAYYNLQYMVMRTALPKREWYQHYWGLYEKTASTGTLLRRMLQSPTFHWRPALGRAYIMGRRAPSRIWKFIDEQVEMEETLRYEDIEHTLLPSLRRDYVPNNYYNAATLAAMNENAANRKTS
ncbi:radical SAM protein [Heliobacterium undosum]|uniref:Radical SAM protein n=1 Tax=Heliomicrobium undosum TaxID=121734 RepID=A0A845L4M8_9FIRM|nr:radical SAM protein [Heliomicrobium undosum]MZP29995.1 radical SAM protein [Heliomicrobium undosum]